jgi:hypothetical protein
LKSCSRLQEREKDSSRIEIKRDNFGRSQLVRVSQKHDFVIEYGTPKDLAPTAIVGAGMRFEIKPRSELGSPTLVKAQLMARTMMYRSIRQLCGLTTSPQNNIKPAASMSSTSESDIFSPEEEEIPREWFEPVFWEDFWEPTYDSAFDAYNIGVRTPDECKQDCNWSCDVASKVTMAGCGFLALVPVSGTLLAAVCIAGSTAGELYCKYTCEPGRGRC